MITQKAAWPNGGCEESINCLPPGIYEPDSEDFDEFDALLEDSEHAAETVITMIRLLNELADLSEWQDFGGRIPELHAELVEKCKIANHTAQELGLPIYSLLS